MDESADATDCESGESTLSTAWVAEGAGMSGESALAESMLAVAAGSGAKSAVGLSSDCTEVALATLSEPCAVVPCDGTAAAVGAGESKDWTLAVSPLEPTCDCTGAGDEESGEFTLATDADASDAAPEVWVVGDAVSSGESNVESNATPTRGAENMGTFDCSWNGVS